MVLETSALVSILLFEPQRAGLIAKIVPTGGLMAAPSLLESHMVLKREYRERTMEVIEKMLLELGVSVVPFTEDHAKEAARAFDRYGKGRHPAALNFGDCAAYALAKISGQPLLFVGDDFSRTDVKVA